MKPRLIALIACGLLVFAASAAFAQYETSDRSLLGLRVAVYRPTDSLLRNLGTNWLGPVIDYNWRFDRQDKPQVKVSFGWFGEDKGVDKAAYLPLTATYIKRFYKENPNRCWFAGGGAGVYFVSFRHWATIPPGLLRMVKDSSTEFGVNLVGGYESGPWFAELRYDLSSDLGLTGGGKVDFSGFTVSIGTNIAF